MLVAMGMQAFWERYALSLIDAGDTLNGAAMIACEVRRTKMTDPTQVWPEDFLPVLKDDSQLPLRGRRVLSAEESKHKAKMRGG
jgi:hypothetical protein